MTAKILCLASAKGGSGKTSLTATIGTFLAQLNKSVLMIDSDFGTNGLTLLFLKQVRLTAELTMAESVSPSGVLNGLASGRCQVVQLSEKLHFIPADFYLSGNASQLADDQLTTAFSTLLLSFRDKYDYILIDAQAGSDAMARASMSRRVSDEVIIVTEYDPMSAAGVERLKALIREDLTYERTWILLNKILPEFAKSFSDFLSVAKYLSPVPWDVEVVRAYSRRELAINTDTGNGYTLTVLQTLKMLFGTEIKEEIELWIKSRAAEIRQPILQQYEDAEKELATLLKIKVDFEKRRRDLLLRSILIFICSAAGLGLAIVYLADKPFGLFSSSKFGSALALLLPIAVATMATAKAIEKWASQSSIESKISNGRIERQLNAVDEKLRRLETLRAMDAERLLATKNTNFDESTQ